MAGPINWITPKKVTFTANMAAWEGVLGPNISEPIVWNFGFGFDVSNPTATRVIMSGTKKRFPAYEIYIKKSSGDNMPVYQWMPDESRDIIPYLFITETVGAPDPVEVIVP